MTLDQIIYFIFLTLSIALAVFVGLRFKQIKKTQAAYQAEYDEKREKYRTLTSEQFDNTPVTELTHVALFHIMSKEDKMYELEDLEGVKLTDYLTHPEKLIYTIYLLELSLEGGRGSIHSFFIEEKYKEFVPYASEAFEAVKCFEIAELLKSAAKLAYVVEHDLDLDEIQDEGDYGSYNFADYTSQFLSMVKSSAIVELSGNYIRAHKEDFIDKTED